jgi:hypothetical protein
MFSLAWMHLERVMCGPSARAVATRAGLLEALHLLTDALELLLSELSLELGQFLFLLEPNVVHDVGDELLNRLVEHRVI